MSRLMLLIPALVLLMLSIPLSVAAQDATPAATPPAGTIFPIQVTVRSIRGP